MEKRSYISPWQVVVVLAVTRMLFSTAHFITLKAGRSIQDVLPALPVNFLLNLLVAMPLLALGKRWGGRDPAECAATIWGKTAGGITAVIYFVYFGAFAVISQGTFRLYFRDAVITDAGDLTVYLPLLIVVAFGVCKGIESIMRFGTVIFFLVAIGFAGLMLTLIPSIQPKIGYRFLLPFFYNGPGVMLEEVMFGFNVNLQPACVVFLLPFLKSGTSGGKIFFKWDLIAGLLLLVEFGLCVAVLGPFGASQFYPLRAISAQSAISVFDRLDSLYNIVWMLNALLAIMLYTFLQVNCLTKLGLNRHYRLMVVVVGAVNVVAARILENFPVMLRSIGLNWYFTGFNVFALVLFPLILLIGSLAKGKEPAHETA